MTTKIIGLDSLKHIKSYVDRIKGNIKEELDIETKKYQSNFGGPSLH